MLKLVIN